MQGQGLWAHTTFFLLGLSKQACLQHKGVLQEMRFTSIPNLQLHQLAGCLTTAQSWA